MIEVFFLHNKKIPQDKFLFITGQWGMKIMSDDKKVVGIIIKEDYKNMASVVRAILDLNDAEYYYPKDFDWSTAG